MVVMDFRSQTVAKTNRIYVHLIFKSMVEELRKCCNLNSAKYSTFVPNSDIVVLEFKRLLISFYFFDGFPLIRIGAFRYQLHITTIFQIQF